MAYNDDNENKLRLKHFFFPGTLSFAIEAILAIILLIAFNLTAIGNTLLFNKVDQTNPIEFARAEAEQIWHLINQLEVFRQVSLFLLWAIVGILVYLLLFNLIRIIFGLIYSAEDFSKFVKEDSKKGIFYWLLSLHYFFRNVLVKIAGTILLFTSITILFSYASNQLKIAISEDLSDSWGSLTLSLLVAVFAMRLLVSGIGLLIPSFRSWYYA